MNFGRRGWGGSCLRPGMCSLLRALGMALIAIGVLLLLVAVPFEIWIGLVGIVAIVVGFLLARLC